MNQVQINKIVHNKHLLNKTLPSKSYKTELFRRHNKLLMQMELPTVHFQVISMMDTRCR